VSPSPIERLLAAVDRLDLEAVLTFFAPDARLLTADGRRAEGSEAVRGLLSDLLGELRATTHRITAQWHPDEVWIAEVEASYELQDRMRLNALPRAFVLRQGPDGIVDLRVYGAHERLLSDHGAGEGGIRVGERWIPPL
jgi:SnoaL-like domain